jgi:outer membrane lipoprotein-sorting protein
MTLTGISRGVAFVAVVSIALQAGAASKNAKPKPEPQSSAASASGSDPLENVTHTMDQTAANFRTAQADFVWTTFNSVANEIVGTDKGRIYFRRSGKDIEMAADVTSPAPKQIVFTGGKIQVYQPAIGQIDTYDAGAHRDEFETFLVLGFGSSGSEMRKSFDIKYVGQEKIGTAETAKIELTPLSEKVKQQFPKIDLWIDLQNGLSLRQQLWQTGGDYRLADYSTIQLNKKLPENFKLKTSGSTKIVTH